MPWPIVVSKIPRPKAMAWHRGDSTLQFDSIPEGTGPNLKRNSRRGNQKPTNPSSHSSVRLAHDLASRKAVTENATILVRRIISLPLRRHAESTWLTKKCGFQHIHRLHVHLQYNGMRCLSVTRAELLVVPCWVSKQIIFLSLLQTDTRVRSLSHIILAPLGL